jgi:hypothetical protein
MVLIAGCSKKSSQQDQVASELGIPPATVAERRAYVINSAGIRFDPPASWDATRIDVESRSGQEAAAVQRGADFTVTFHYKAEQPNHRNSPLLNLYVLQRSEWDGNAVAGAVVDSTDEWVFLARMPEANPYREGLLDADQFEAMRLNLEDVRDAFSIENDGPADATLRAESKGK